MAFSRRYPVRSSSLPRCFVILLCYAASILQAAEGDPISYDDQIKPILRQHCLKCHGDDKQKADLNLQSFAAALKGGSGGEAVIAGRSSQSLLFQVITDPDDDSRMPPNKSAIPEDQISLIQKWIDTGLRETAAGKSMLNERDTSFEPSSNVGMRPEKAAMPHGYPTIKTTPTIRPLPILAMDSSPWAPLLAVAGQEQIRLIDTETEALLGILPFPEGIPYVIRFSRDGSVLLVGGGRPVESGSVVLFDVETGKRLVTIGDELDAVLAANLSPDQKLIALGGSGKIVKVYSTANRELVYKIEKHTDWITSVNFSPDGTKLATADRAGGLHLWDANSGGIILSLLEHKKSIHAIDWRLDSKMLASASEDGKVIWWDVSDGFPAWNKSNAHPPKRPDGVHGTIPNGILSARFSPKGNLITTGRDRTVQVWDARAELVKKFKNETGLPISSAMTHDGHAAISGDSDGNVFFWREGLR